MLTIRPVKRTDLPAITAIYAVAVREGTASFELDPPNLAEMISRWRSLAGRDFPYIVAIDEEDRLVGYAYAGPFRAREAYRFMVEDSIYVAAEAKGKGIGRALLGALLEACEKKGYRQVLAVIGDGETNQASVKLHASLGFAHSGTIKGSGFKHGRWLDTVLMQIALNGGTQTLPEA